jgi:hypothetical protein
MSRLPSETVEENDPLSVRRPLRLIANRTCMIRDLFGC